MSILDQKTRILDSIVTVEGRRQIASGKLKAEYYSFTDATAFYSHEDTFASGSSKEGNGIAIPFQLETTSLPQDSVTFEADDSGKLFFRELKNINGANIQLIEGTLFSGSLFTGFQPVSGSGQFASLAEGILTSSINNFKKLTIIGSPDIFDQTRDEFIADPKNINFTITDDSPILSQQKGGTQTANIDNIESLFADKRLSHIPNFQYLPPINKPKIGTRTGRMLGLYQKIGQRPILSLETLELELKKLEEKGYMQEVKFTETSSKNRVFGQFFELSQNSMKKLDVIDFGLFTDTNTNITDETYQELQRNGRASLTKHVFFVGKLFIDSTGSHTFVNMFTLVFTK